jgi:hypothetical protein
MKITLPYRASTMTVHLDQPRHTGFLCTDTEDEEIGILYKNGILYTFVDSEYSPPVEWQNATNYTPPFSDWWQDEFIKSYDEEEN